MSDLKTTSTDDILSELRSRSKVLFVAMRPMAEHRDFTAVVSMGVDGSKVVTAGDRDRCLGLAFQAMNYCIPKEIEV